MTSRARRKAKVSIARNFERNLGHIEEFFLELLNDLSATVVPLLERTPSIGTPIEVSATGGESGSILARVVELLAGDELRQLVRGDFLVLYLVSGKRVHLLAVRHHREKGFTFMQP